MIEAFIIIGFAAWRMASLLSTEEGPNGMFCRLRERVAGFKHSPTGKIISRPDTNLARGLSCVWCTGCWMTGVATAVWFLVSPIPVLIMAAAGLVVLIEQIIRPAK